MNKPLSLFLIVIIMTVPGLLQPVGALPFNIISDPDPPPTATVGRYYKVTFTTDSGYKMDQWICEPENPIPGLKFSEMTGVASITLEGKPRQEGTYSFTLKAYYKGELAAQRSFTIRVKSFSFNIYMLQIYPSIIPPTAPPRLNLQEIYMGDEVLIVFWTDHPDAKHVSWAGSGALPGTSFNVVNRYKFTQSLPQRVLAAVSGILVQIDPDAPILVMNGTAQQAGTFRTSIRARDVGGKISSRTFEFTVHKANCRLTMIVAPKDIYWDTTAFMFPPQEGSQWDSYRYEETKSVDIDLHVRCRGESHLALATLRVYAEHGFTLERGFNNSGLAFFLEETLPGVYEKTLHLTKTFEINPLALSAPYPGKDYTVIILVIPQNDTLTYAQDMFTVTVYHKVPEIAISDLQPISQLSNPHHLIWPSTTGVPTKNLLVKDKQATFRFNYTNSLPYPVRVQVRLELPKVQWQWNPQNEATGSVCFISAQASPEILCPNLPLDKVITYSENSESYIIKEYLYLQPTPSGEQKTAILLKKMWGVKGAWFPKPVQLGVSATLTLLSIGRLSTDELSINTKLTDYFYSAISRLGGFRIGYYILDQSAFTSQEKSDMHSNFPDALRIYLEGVFPVVVKEVRWMGYVDPPEDKDALSEKAAEIQEEIIEADIHRAVVIVPHDYLNSKGGEIVGGIVFRSSDKVAFVDYIYAIDNGNYKYLPVVAHELSHTFYFPDIYYGKFYPRDLCTSCRFYGINYSRLSGTWPAGEPPNAPCSGSPLVLGYFAFFDEVNGGLISVSDGRGISDIMDCALGPSWAFWPYHSWDYVRVLSQQLDPPTGLLVSMLIYRNGTVKGRPFTVIYNHSQPYLAEDRAGTFELQLVSKSGDLLKSYPINISFGVFDAPNFKIEVASIVTVVELFDDLGEIRLVDAQGNILFSRKVSDNKPTVSFTFPISGLKLEKSKTYKIAWKAYDADGDALWFNVHMRKIGDRAWTILAHRIRGNTLNYTVSEQLKPGAYELLVKATDGVNTGYNIVRIEVVEEAPSYNLTVTSNIGVEIAGSGIYEEGSNVTLNAPREISMPGLLGALGARYVFNRWEGFVNSTSNPVSFIIHSERPTITVAALYSEDLSPALMKLIIAAIAFTVLAASIQYMLRKRGKRRRSS